MKIISTRQAAKKLGLHPATLANYITVGKLPAPNTLQIGGTNVYAWTEEEIENARQLLPKIANGRKTRYKKLKEKQKAPRKKEQAKKRKQTS